MLYLALIKSCVIHVTFKNLGFINQVMNFKPILTNVNISSSRLKTQISHEV